MKKILIISPHFPPSNVAGVHRARLFAQHLPSYGWEPIILMVNEKYYEEEPDINLTKLLHQDLRIEKVNAFRISKPRLVGDIGIRAFMQLTKKAINIIRSEKIDFLYIPIPSFYIALIGRIVHAKTKVPYGIDYIDPWVHHFAGSEKIFSRHWWSTKLSEWLEPIAVKRAALITGVAEGYYEGVISRNPLLIKKTVFTAMPYGGEKEDHEKVKQLSLKPYLFKQKNNKLQLMYAGAMLPKAYAPMERLFNEIAKQPELFNELEIHFVGTGQPFYSSAGYMVKPYAEKYGLWQKQIFEYPKRVPYLDVLVQLEAATGTFILGSTEPHYTPSKVYQGVLAGKPLWAVLHSRSTACDVIKKSGAGIVLEYEGEKDLDKINSYVGSSYISFRKFVKQFKREDVKQEEFDRYSARSVTALLSKALNSVTVNE